VSTIAKQSSTVHIPILRHSMLDPNELVKCPCGREAMRSEFPRKRNGTGHLKTCTACTLYAQKYRESHKKCRTEDRKENNPQGSEAFQSTGPVNIDGRPELSTWSALKSELSGVLQRTCTFEAVLELPQITQHEIPQRKERRGPN
jgi:hypothetical protein